MRDIDFLVVHCAATKPKMDVGAKEIRQWHLDKGWADIGYHYVIRRSGEVEKGRLDEIPGAHVAGHNKNSIGICLVGGIDDDGHPEPNFTQEQFTALDLLLDELVVEYDLTEDAILGHRDFPGVGKACPSFDVRKWRKSGNVELY
jgi:N-acetyl-anhydromuramyl-L-alanine amidase AmpD